MAGTGTGTGTGPRGSGLAGAILGATAPLRGLALLLGSPSLWPLAVIPVVLAAVLFGALAAGAWWGHGPLLGWFWPLGEGQAAGFWRGVAGWALWLAFALAALVGTALLAPAVAEPALAALARRVRLARAGPLPPQPGGLYIAVVTPVVNQARKIGFLLAVEVLLLPLLIIPGGAIVYGGASLGLAWFLLGLTYLEYPLETGPRPLTPRERRAWFWRHAPAGLALGAVTSLTALVPCLTFLVLPIAVVSATLLYLDLGGDASVPRA